MMQKKPAPKKPSPAPTAPVAMRKMAQLMQQKVQRNAKRGK